MLPEELGAILWAFDFGGQDGAVHTVGIARSLGFGRVRFALKSADLMRNDGRDAGASVSEECLARFVKTMEEWGKAENLAGGWRESVQLRELLACAKPLPEGSKDGKHLDLNHPFERNQFTSAKKDGLALSPASGIRGKVPASQTPTTSPQPAPGNSRPGGYGGRSDRGGPGRGGPQGKQGRWGNIPPSTGPAPRATAGPKSKDKVNAVLIEEKTKKGGWMAALLGDEKKRKGAIQNSSEVSAECAPGQEVELVVALINDKEVAFRWPK